MKHTFNLPGKNMLFFFIFSFALLNGEAQSDFNTLNPIRGYRLSGSGHDVFIYGNTTAGAPNFMISRRMNNRVYFRFVKSPSVTVSGKKYLMITIPGQRARSLSVKASGSPIDASDFDLIFWIDEEDVKEDFITPEYVKYKGDVISGLLTAPFKSRLKAGNTNEGYVDGSFNAGAFIGGKLSLGGKTPTYISLAGFLQISTLTYNSSNNTKITDLTANESGAGYSYGLGLIFRIATVSPGLIIGWDHGFSDNGKTFLYQDKPWLSFSLNFDFIKPKESKKENE